MTMIFGCGDCAWSVVVAARAQTTNNNGRTNFFKLPAPFISDPMRQVRKGGLVLPTKPLPDFKRLPAFSECSRDVNTFFELRIKKCVLAGPVFQYYYTERPDKWIFHNFAQTNRGLAQAKTSDLESKSFWRRRLWLPLILAFTAIS